MYHPPSKRTQLLRRITVYGAMTVSVIIFVVILVFVTLGYQFDQAKGRVEQGGLVQFDTRSGSATITIDGTDFGAQTPAKTTLLPGQHTFTMSAKGYDTWRKTVDVTAGSVLWLNYARLVPQTLTPSSVASFPALASTAASPNQHWIAIQDAAGTPSLRLADITQEPVVMTTLPLPSGSYTIPKDAATQSFAIQIWDPSSRYVLLKHQYDASKVEWIIVDTQDVKQTKNLTAVLGVDAKDVKFSLDNGLVLYGVVDQSIRKMSLIDNTISAPLVQNVASFSLFDRSTLTYVTSLSPDTKQRSVGYYTDGASKPRSLRSYSDNGTTPLHVALGRYYGDTYTSIAYGDTVDILRGSLPRSDTPGTSTLRAVATMTIPSGVNYLSSSTEGRFIVAQHGSAYSTYDLELGKMTTTPLKSKTAPPKQLAWVDGYYLVDDQAGTARLYEFDGANQHVIMPVVAGMSVTLSPNGRYLYGFSKDDKGTYHLSRVQMIL